MASWLQQPGPAPAVGALAGVALLTAFRPTGAAWRTRAALGLAFGMLVALSVAEIRRRALVASRSSNGVGLADAGRRLQAALDAAALRLGSAATTAVQVDVSSGERAFARLGAIRDLAGSSVAIAILDSDGRPVVWAGRFLASPAASGDSLSVVRTPFYVVLEARRQRSDGGTAVAAIPLWRDGSVARSAADSMVAVRAPPGITIAYDAPRTGDTAAREWPARGPLVGVRLAAPAEADAFAAITARARAVVAWLLLGFLLAAASASGPAALRATPVALGLLLAAFYPIGDALGAATAFSPAWYFSPLGGRLTSSAGLLALASLAVLLGGLALWDRAPLPRRAGSIAGTALALAVPLLTRELARGITPPAPGVATKLWLTWQVALFLAAFGVLVVAAALVRGDRSTGSPRWPLIGAGWSVAVALIGVFAFTGRPGWPAWYLALWVPAAVLVVRPAAPLPTLASLALAAGAGAAVMTWGNALAARTVLALDDVATLGTQPDPLAEPALTDLAAGIVATSRPPDAADLYRAWRRSGLRREGYPARLTVWDGDTLSADVTLDALSLSDSALAALVSAAPPGQSITRIAVGPGVHQVLTRRLDSRRVLALAAGPRTRLIPPAVLGRLLETGAERSPLYLMTVTPARGLEGAASAGRWRRASWAIRATRRVLLPAGPHEAHLVIPLGRPASILVRGALVLIADVVLAGMLWVFALWLLRRRVVVKPPWAARSYETRLAVTLAAFFVVPAALVSTVSIRQLAVEAERSRDLVLERILRDAARLEPEPLADVARRLDAGLGSYHGGRLVAASDPVLAALGLIPPMVDEPAWHALMLDGEPFASTRETGYTRRGFAVAGQAPDGAPTILATVHEERDREVRDRQVDVALGFGLATLLGLFAAGGAARVAARTLSRPVADLRDAAIAFGRGTSAPPFPVLPPREFEPVFTAFARMAADVRAGQDALEAARRRTEAVLATVPTGVLALDGEGRVILANRSAADLLGDGLPIGRALRDATGDDFAALVRLVEGARPEAEGEFEAGGRRYHARVTALEGVGGSVVAVNDVTEATRAARVLAWADVANQVAHAIKNPLTPLRLGIQHLRRVREQRPDQFDTALQETTDRLLAEIARLDAIARAFARLAAPSETELPLEAVALREVCDEVAALYRLAPGFELAVTVPAGARVTARRDELREVLLNLCDNARNAGATRVEVEWTRPRLRLSDDGQGMAPEVVEHAFEPRFSTTSSGSGLGLAIVRRLVEGWGARIIVDPSPGRGATFVVDFVGPSDRLTV